MPVLEPYKDGNGFYIRVGYGESGVGTWQIGPPGIAWLQKHRRLSPAGTFSRTDFEYLKKAGLILNGGRELQGRLGNAGASMVMKSGGGKGKSGAATHPERPIVRTIETNERREDGSRKKIHYITYDSPTQKAFNLQSANTQAKRPKQLVTEPEARSGRDVSVLGPIRVNTVSKVPRLILVWNQEGEAELALQLPGFRRQTALTPYNLEKHEQTVLEITGLDHPFEFSRLETDGSRVVVRASTGCYKVIVRNRAFDPAIYRPWAIGCQGLNANRTMFAGHDSGFRLRDGHVLDPTRTYAFLWRRDLPPPPWVFTQGQITPLASDPDWLAARIQMPECISNAQRAWLLKARVNPSALKLLSK